MTRACTLPNMTPLPLFSSVWLCPDAICAQFETRPHVGRLGTVRIHSSLVGRKSKEGSRAARTSTPRADKTKTTAAARTALSLLRSHFHSSRPPTARDEASIRPKHGQRRGHSRACVSAHPPPRFDLSQSQAYVAI
jgi:hypothetical protein